MDVSPESPRLYRRLRAISETAVWLAIPGLGLWIGWAEGWVAGLMFVLLVGIFVEGCCRLGDATGRLFRR